MAKPYILTRLIGGAIHEKVARECLPADKHHWNEFELRHELAPQRKSNVTAIEHNFDNSLELRQL